MPMIVNSPVVLEESITRLFGLVHPGGLLFVDSISTEEVRQQGGPFRSMFLASIWLEELSMIGL